LEKIWEKKKNLGEQLSNLGQHKVYYSRKVHYFLQALDFVPEVYDGKGKLRSPTDLKVLAFADEGHAEIVFCLLNSSLFRWFLATFSDLRHINKREVENFRIDLQKALHDNQKEWTKIAENLSKQLRDTSEYRQMRFEHDNLRVQCIIPKHSKGIIDNVDRLLAKHYGFTDEELDFIINYDIKYRMGKDAEGEEE
jgi:hypothetical protein